MRRAALLSFLVLLACEGSPSPPPPPAPATDEPPDLAAWLQRLDEGDVYERAAAREALAGFGTEAVDPLRERLHRPEPGLRYHAVLSLAAMRPLPLKALSDALRSTDGRVRRIGLDAVVEAGPAGLTAFEPTLGHPDHNVREDAVQAVVRIGPESLRFVERVLRDPDPRVRRAAVRALGVLGDSGRPMLETVAHGEDPGMRREALRLLESPESLDRGRDRP